MTKQLVGKTILNRCCRILNSAVVAGFMNGPLPHGIVEVWTDTRNAFLVNLKTKDYMLYVDNGKFVMRRGVVRVKPIEHTAECEQQQFATGKCKCYVKEFVNSTPKPTEQSNLDTSKFTHKRCGKQTIICRPHSAVQNAIELFCTTCDIVCYDYTVDRGNDLFVELMFETNISRH